MRVFTHLVKHDKDMPLTRGQVLMVIAMRPDCLVRDIMQATGLSQSTIARSIAFLGDKPVRGNKDGLKWVEMRPDKEDPRRARINLTAKGKSLMAEIENLMED
jgi:DNA-binding MarR family transcriptional regulator